VAIENVPSLASAHDGAFGRWVSAALAEVGCDTISLNVLNAADYGVPQDRKRAIMLANPWGFPNPYPAPILAEPFHRSVDSAIGDLRGLPQGAVPNHLWPVPGAELQARISALRHGEPLNERFTGGCRRLWPDRPGFTMMGNHGQPHVHPHEHRFLSVREMARLQGFPDRFTIEGNVRQQQDQVANAIPPPLAEHVALALRPLLDAVSERPDAAGYPACPRTPVAGSSIAVA
jgi:DNA (cytosine-5)-methyltransferase 1